MADKEGTIKVVDEEEGLVILEEYDGETRRFEVIDVLKAEGTEYLILMDEQEEVGEGYALRVEEDEAGDKVYRPVVEEEELVKLQKLLEEEPETE